MHTVWRSICTQNLFNEDIYLVCSKIILIMQCHVTSLPSTLYSIPVAHPNQWMPFALPILDINPQRNRNLYSKQIYIQTALSMNIDWKISNREYISNFFGMVINLRQNISVRKVFGWSVMSAVICGVDCPILSNGETVWASSCMCRVLSMFVNPYALLSFRISRVAG